MTQLAQWLQQQITTHRLSQQDVAGRAGISIATVNAILKSDHIPKIPVLLHLAAAFHTTPTHIHHLAAGLPPDPDQHPLTPQLLHHFHRIPEAHKQTAVDQLALLARLTTREDQE